MSAKPILHIQTDLFSEDSENPNASLEAASEFFEVKRLPDGITRRIELLRVNGMRDGLRISLDYARLLGRAFPFTNAMNWLPVFRELCVSEDAYFTDALHALDTLWQNSGSHKFIRPVSGFKTFSGGCFGVTSFKNELEFLKQNKNIHPREVICVVATPRVINHEWRLIYIDGQYISGSHYMTNGKPSFDLGVPREAIALGNHVASQDFFANNFAFVLDIALVERQCRLLEVNAFETASFYKADLRKVYEAYAKSLTKE